jgi:CYTH domain-containing protein
MATEIEYEKTYLAKRLPEGLDMAKSVLIRDVYVPETARHAVLRIRAKNDDYVITKKTIAHGTDSSTMNEETIPLSVEEYGALVGCSNKGFVKRRYFVAIDGYSAEVDVFDEQLKGLVLIDFEFSSQEAKDEFVVPDICFADVTQEEGLAGGILAGKSYEDIAPILKKYAYNKLEVSHEI